MAATRPIHIDVPEELFEKMQEAAERSDQPVETVLVGSLALLFGDPPPNWDQLEATLESLPDDQLWALVYRRLAWPESARLHDLVARGRLAPLTDDEQRELEALIDDADRYTLVRSRALLLLKGRGYDVEARLKLSA